MKRSFKLHIFIRLFLLAALIIGSNRLLAQYFLTDQLRDQVHQDMAWALRSCGDALKDREKFLSCFKARDKGGLISNVSDFYVLCQTPVKQTGRSSIEACPGPFDRDIVIHHQGSDAQTDAIRGRTKDEVWFAVRHAGELNGPEVWLKQTDADKMVHQMWGLRDHNLLRVLPVVLGLLVLMTWYVTRWVMRPIDSIEQAMSGLNASNLGQTNAVKAPFQEFEKLVKVFEGLRVRLNDSFTKARRFASDASHELRTPLTILRGGAERLIQDLPTGSELQVRARNMGDEVERLIDITEKLLLLSRADANSLGRAFSDVDLSQMIQALIAVDEDDGKSHLKITSDISPGVVWRCDKTLVRQLIRNLFENAQRYNQAQGWIHVALTQAEGQFQLTVENPSVNISPDLSQHAFDRFYRGDASHTRQIDGLGLGLSICAEIAKIHQGTLSLRVTDKKTVLLVLTAPLHDKRVM